MALATYKEGTMSYRTLFLTGLLIFCSAIGFSALKAMPQPGQTGQRAGHTMYLPMLTEGNSTLPEPIVFTLRSDENFDLYLARPGVATYQRLTNDPAMDYEPALSPDGSKVAFSSYRDNKQEIYLLDLTTLALQQLTSSPGVDDQPAWSADGSQIAFVSQRNGQPEIYTMQVDGSEQQRVTNGLELTNKENPSWSPDGSSLAFAGTRFIQPHIYTVHIFTIRLDGSQLRQITPDTLGTTNLKPDWSATNKLIFSSNQAQEGEPYHYELYRINSDGSDLTRLTNNTFDENRASWSPDGQWIAFDASPYGNYDIFFMRADGTQTHRLTGPPGQNAWADW
jgi:Tol biopolymer transport system component